LSKNLFIARRLTGYNPNDIGLLDIKVVDSARFGFLVRFFWFFDNFFIYFLYFSLIPGVAPRYLVWYLDVVQF
jgi:hypothetical protein